MCLLQWADALVLLSPGFPNLKPGSLRADEADINVRVNGSADCRVLCAAAPMGTQPAPTSQQILLGLLSDGVTLAPNVWLSSSFRPTRYALIDGSPVNQTDSILSMHMWLGVDSAHRDLDIYCSTFDFVDSRYLPQAAVAASQTSVRFLSRTCQAGTRVACLPSQAPRRSLLYDASRWPLAFQTALQQINFNMSLADMLSHGTGAAPAGIVTDEATGLFVTSFQTLGTRLLMTKDLAVKAYDAMTATVTMNITRTWVG